MYHLGGEEIFFKVKVTMSRRRADKSHCQNYERSDGYTQCLELAVRKKLIELLGCLPPWLPIFGNESVCNDDMKFKDVEAYDEVRSKLAQFVEDIFTFADVAELESECEEPCQQMKFQILKRQHRKQKFPYFYLQVKK